MDSSNVDVAVLLLFFARPGHTRQVFEAIKKARPSKLFLYQDGPREGRNDEEKIIACRQIVEDIDWDCEVYRNYQKHNFGCDPSEYMAQKWMFSIVDRGIILEDDDVPSQSFFPFCKELLDRYADDQRINMICGMNNLGTYDSGDDYFFAQGGSIWGWASWRRVIDEWDDKYAALDDKYSIRLLRKSLGRRRFEELVRVCERHKATKKAHYESILGLNVFLQSRLNIIPSKNMIKNIGLGDDTTHSVSSIHLLPHKIRRVMNMQTHEISFPLKHPEYIINNCDYLERVDKLMFGNGLVRFFRLRRVESLLYRVFPFLGRIIK